MNNNNHKADNAYHNLIDSIKQRLEPDTKKCVLIVDDEMAIRKRIARDIKKTDATIQIIEAGNGLEAIQELKNIHATGEPEPIFIVLDLNMPLMTGWEFIEQLKQDYEQHNLKQGIPIIVLSSTSGETGFVFFKKSVHNQKSGYSPLITIAKESCIKPTKYSTQEQEGLMAWIKYFLHVP